MITNNEGDLIGPAPTRVGGSGTTFFSKWTLGHFLTIRTLTDAKTVKDPSLARLACHLVFSAIIRMREHPTSL